MGERIGLEISNLVNRLTVASPSQPRTNCPWKGRGYITWPFWGPHLYLRNGWPVKFCT